MLFTQPIEGTVVLNTGGSYYEAPLFFCEKEAYAKYGRGYIKLYKGNGTSKPKVYWHKLDVDLNKFDAMTMVLRPSKAA